MSYIEDLCEEEVIKWLAVIFCEDPRFIVEILRYADFSTDIIPLEAKINSSEMFSFMIHYKDKNYLKKNKFRLNELYRSIRLFVNHGSLRIPCINRRTPDGSKIPINFLYAITTKEFDPTDFYSARTQVFADQLSNYYGNIKMVIADVLVEKFFTCYNMEFDPENQRKPNYIKLKKVISDVMINTNIGQWNVSKFNIDINLIIS